MTETNWFEDWVVSVYKKENHKHGLLSDIFNVVTDVVPDLLYGIDEGEISRKQIDLITDTIEKDHCFRDRTIIRHVLSQLLSAASLRKWTTAPLAVYMVIRNEHSRYNYEYIYNLSRYNNLVKIFFNSLELLKSDDYNDIVSVFVLGCIMWDGVLDMSRLKMLLECRVCDSNMINGNLCINVPVNPKLGVPGMMQRVYFSDITRMIIQHIKAKMKRDSIYDDSSLTFASLSHDLKTLLKKTLSTIRNINVDDTFRVKSLSDVMSITRAGISSPTPSYLIDYSTGKNFSVSEYSGIDSPTNQKSYDGSSEISAFRLVKSVINDHHEKITTVLDHESSYYILNTITALIHSGKKDISFLLIKKYESVLGKLGVFLCEWHLHRKNTKKTNSAISIDDADYYEFAEQLYFIFLQYNYTLDTSSDYEDLYTNVITQQQRTVDIGKYSHLITVFHKFLDLHKKISIDIDYDNIDLYVDSSKGVNAIVLETSMFESAKSAIINNTDNNRLSEIRYLMLVIAYRMGLRRNEIRQLRICDVRFTRTMGHMELFPDGYGFSKSLAARRNLPIHDLLSADEYEQLLSWWQKRKVECTNLSDPFFTANVNDEYLINVNNTFDFVVSTLRKVTSDDRVKFHSLRHSFATNFLLLFESERLPSLRKHLEIEKGEAFFNVPGPRYWKTLNASESSRRLLFQLANIIGHTKPLTTLHHYIHSVDLVLFHYMKLCIPYVTKSTLCNLLGLSSSQLFDRLTKSSLESKGNSYSISECVEQNIFHRRITFED